MTTSDLDSRLGTGRKIRAGATPAPMSLPGATTSIRCTSPVIAFLCCLCLLLLLGPCSAYSPDVNHRTVAGLWKLKQILPAASISYPLKEFTVYPKVPRGRSNSNDSNNSSNSNNNNSKKEVLLMLKEDGSFQQYSSDEQQIPDKMRDDGDGDILDRYCEFGKLKGKWNLVGGRLILAADRPMDDRGKSMTTPNRDITDTILEGEIVATTEQGLVDNPVLGMGDPPPKDNDGARAGGSGSDSNSDGDIGRNSGGGGGNPGPAASSSRSSSNPSSKAKVLDTHLSVPKGRVNIGRFTYPTHHPSFFDAPMFNPRAGGNFELRQVLGTLNTRDGGVDDDDENQLVEKFKPKDFYNKTFLLSSRPIPEYQPKGTKRWSIKYNKFVEDPHPKSKKQKDDESMLDQPVHNIRVLELKFFANNTFATTGGMGGSAILRGRFSVIGEKRDHIWMQVMRFGFGRSVSGSVFSEGRSLSKDDEKAYWGKIEHVNDNGKKSGDADTNTNTNTNTNTDSNAPATLSENKAGDSGTETETADEDAKLIVKGSVLFGYGLEPMPIGLFVLTETNSAEEYDSDDDEEEDDDDDDDSDDFDDGQFFLDSDSVFQ
eukprot:jgi/Psemu1/63826/estExt_Genemark1.C_390013